MKKYFPTLISVFVILIIIIIAHNKLVTLITPKIAEIETRIKELNSNHIELKKFVRNNIDGQFSENKIHKFTKESIKLLYEDKKEFLIFSQWAVMGMVTVFSIILTVFGYFTHQFSKNHRELMEKEINLQKDEQKHQFKLLDNEIQRIKANTKKIVSDAIESISFDLFIQLFNLAKELIEEEKDQETDAPKKIPRESYQIALSYFSFLYKKEYHLIHVCRYLGICYEHFEDYEEAISYMNKAIKHAEDEGQNSMLKSLKEEIKKIKVKLSP